MPLIIALLVTLFFGYFLYRAIFDGLDDLIDSIKFYFSSDILDWLMGNREANFWAEFKLFIWLGMTGLIGYGTYITFANKLH